MDDHSVEFVRGNKILFQTSAGSTVLLELKPTQPSGHPLPPEQLLAWAQIAATRENTAQFERLADSIEKMADAGADQAAAVREQTDQMQRNMDDARANVPDVMEILTEQLPEIMRKLQVGGGALNLETLFPSKTTVDRSEGSA